MGFYELYYCNSAFRRQVLNHKILANHSVEIFVKNSGIHLPNFMYVSHPHGK